MKFYIASKYENMVSVADLIALLTRFGYEVTHDWTTGSEHWDWDVPGATEAHAPIASAADVRGVMAADVFIMLSYTDKPMIGALVELGVALAEKKDIYIVGAQPRNIFAYHPLVKRRDNIGEVLYELIEDYGVKQL